MSRMEYLTDVPLPKEPYNWRLLQVGVLIELGYPVSIEDTPKKKARQRIDSLPIQESDPRTPLLRHQLSVHNNWWRPTVDPAFRPWIIDLIPEGCLPETLDSRNRIVQHPAAVLLPAVDAGDFAKVRSFIESNGKSTFALTGIPNLTRTLRSSFVTAFERRLEIATIDPAAAQVGVSDNTAVRISIERYRSFKANEVPTVAPEALGELAHDFYVTLGATVPEFAQFSTAAQSAE